MLVDYKVKDIGCFDDYSNAAPRAKIMRGNGITKFLVHIAQCITFYQNIFVTATLISESSLKPFHSRLGFKFIKDFAASPNLEKACKIFHYESGKSEELQKKNPTRCYIPLR